jgi:Fur family ferric uptake transcriptional regulator
MVENSAEVLRSTGHRLTPQRVLVWDVLRRFEGRHLSAEAIHQEVAKVLPTFNVASVYRTLALLSDLGLARETRLGDRRAVWEVHHDQDQQHLVCRSCGEVTHHEDPVARQIAVHLASEHDFTVQDVELIVSGVCGKCRAAAS